MKRKMERGREGKEEQGERGEVRVEARAYRISWAPSHLPV